MEEGKINEDSTTPPNPKRRRLGNSVDSNFLNDETEITADNNEELNSSLFDTAFTSQLPDENDLLPIPENVIENLQPNKTAAEETAEAAPEASEHDSDDDNLPRKVKDIVSWNRVAVNGNEITDKNSIAIIRLCLNSISRCLIPSDNIRLTRNSISMIYRILYRYGFLQNLKFDGKSLSKKSKQIVLSKDMLSTVTINLDLFYKSLNKITEAINNFYWVRYFAIPENISETPLEFRISYNQYLIERIKRFHKAINANDWQQVGQLIGGIDIVNELKAGNNEWYGKFKTLVTYNLLWENLFFIGFQRILLQSNPLRAKAISLELMLHKFSELVITEAFKIRKLLPLFMISVLTFGIAHNNKECVSQILRIKINAKFNEPDLNLNLRAYSLYNQYKEMCEETDTTPTEMLANLFLDIRDFLDSVDEKKMKKLLFLFEPFVLLSHQVDEEATAFEILIRYCNETPALLPYTASILNRCGRPAFIGRLITECVEHDPNSTFLHRFPLIVHYVGQRSIQAKVKGFLQYDVAEKYVRMLFNFFDYGKNRKNGDAWLIFKANLEYLKPFPEWIYQEWNDRSDWWPQFHDIPLDDYEDERNQVFRMLRRQSKKRKV